ncbi:MAG: hypothetical protein DRH08_12370 [Deltaproteobacteria bacterium]|nr:MAG: hypothetical protein DRH08_12370 [Deltaproteobacteria bacterium]
MAAIVEVYVDPSIDANSGAGTSGDPYGDLQYALDTEAAVTNRRFRIKPGTAEVLSAALTGISGTSYNHPCMFVGDGGAAEIDCNGFTLFGTSSLQGIVLAELNMHGSGSADVVEIGQYSSAVNCEVHDSSGDGIVLSQGRSIAIGNNVHDIGGIGIKSPGGGLIAYNYLKDGTKTFTKGIYTVGGSGIDINNNIVSVSGSAVGIHCEGYHSTVISNSVLSSAGTGKGIVFDGSYYMSSVVANNLVEGFSGTGGVGIALTRSQNQSGAAYGNNACYDNATDYDINASVSYGLELGDNESLSASPFAKSGSDTFANRLTYFAPVDTGNVHGGAYGQN